MLKSLTDTQRSSIFLICLKERMEWRASRNLPGKMERQRWKRGNFKRHRGILKGITDVNLWKAGRKPCTRRENKVQMGFTKEKTRQAAVRKDDCACDPGAAFKRLINPTQKMLLISMTAVKGKQICTDLFLRQSKGQWCFQNPVQMCLPVLETPYLLGWLPNLSGLLGKMKFRLKKSRSALLMQ